MPTMELTSTNQEFVLATADLIELKGLAHGQYYDKWDDCYCTLGAFRMLVFGYVEADDRHQPQVKRYLELVDWFASKVYEPSPNDLRNGETVVGMWNDVRTKQTVVDELRKVGRAA